MNKPLIKVFKRPAETGAETNNGRTAASRSLKAERGNRREIIMTISGWVDERREHNYRAEIVARKMLSGSSLPSKRSGGTI